MGSAPIWGADLFAGVRSLSAPPRAAAWAPTKLSNKPCADRPSLTRVEQLQSRRPKLPDAPPIQYNALRRMVEAP